MADPRRRPYFVFWTNDDGLLALALRMERADQGDAVAITTPEGETLRVAILRQLLPRGAGSALLYRCPGCGRPRRHLYPWSLVGRRIVRYLGWRCQACAGLRWASQGSYRGRFDRALSAALGGGRRDPLPRQPWDPRAVSDPRMVLDEFSNLEFSSL